MRFRFMIVALIFSIQAQAAMNEKANVRVFGAFHSFSPSQVNTHLTQQGLNEIKGTAGYGMEIVFPVWSILSLGAKGYGGTMKVFETATPSANPTNPYFASLHHGGGALVARLDVVNTRIFRVDVYGSYGLTGTSLDVRTASGEGTYQNDRTRFEPVTSYGLSVAVGWSNVYLFIEGGAVSEKVTNLTKSGTTSTSVNELDFSGTNISIGLLFTGVPGIFSKANVSTKK